MSSLKRGVWVKGPVDSLEDHCFHFIDAEAEDQRGESVSIFGALGSQARTCPTLYRALDGLPTHVCAGAWERLGQNVILDGREFGGLGGAPTL